MSLSFLFWFLLLVWFLFGGYVAFGPGQPPNRWAFGANFLLFILVIVIGLKLFGLPIRGG